MKTVTVDAKRLADAVCGLLRTHSFTSDAARRIADALVEANLRGVDSHGCTRVAGYVQLVKTKLINPAPDMRVVKSSMCTAVLEGDQAHGIPAGEAAADLAFDLAMKSKVSCVTLRNVGHTGMSSLYPERLAKRGLIGLWMNTSPTCVAPYGSTTRLFGTHPLAIGVPTGDDEPLVLDMSTTLVSLGALRLAAKKGVSIPEDWAVDREGVPTTDPVEAIMHGSLRWVGGYKGSGLAMMIEILCGILSGGAFGAGKPVAKEFGKEPWSTAATCIAIDPVAFIPAEEFFARVRELKDQVAATSCANGFDAVRLPGEPELCSRRARMKSGIPLDGETYEELAVLFAEAGLPFEVTWRAEQG